MAAGGTWGEQDEQTWAAFAEFLRQADIVTDEVDAAQAFTNEHLPQ